MANVYIGTNLQLKDKNFTRNLKKVADDTKIQTDKISKNFASISTALKGLAAAAGGIKIFSEVANSLKQTERSVGSLQAITNSAEAAREKFQELNDLSRKIPQNFDEITQAALTLGKNGLDTSAKSIEALAKINRGTGLSMESLAQAINNATMGQLKGLRQLGIVAKQEGESITLTYQGVTETIGNNALEIQNYFNKLANTKFKDTLKPEMDGITGAEKRLTEAWGDLTRAIGESGIGDIIKSIMNTATKALDSFTKSVQIGMLGDVIQNIKSAWQGIGSTLSSVFEDLGKVAESVAGIMGDAFEDAGDGILSKLTHVLKLAALGFRKLYGWIQGAFNALGVLGERIGSSLQEAMSGGTERIMRDADLKNKYKDLINARISSLTEAERAALEAKGLTTEVLAQKIQSATADGMRQTALMIGVTQQSLDRAKKAADDTRVKMTESSKADILAAMGDEFIKADDAANNVIKEIAENDQKHRKNVEELRKELAVKDSSKSIANGLKGITEIDIDAALGRKGGKSNGGTGGGGSASKDTWSTYYQNFLSEQAKTLSKAEQIEYNYRQKILELDSTFAANSGASMEQYNAVRLVLDKNYFDAKKALEKEALDFIEQLRGNETYTLQNECAQKLELLAQFHEQKLISEQDYLEQEKALRDAYYAEETEILKRKRQEKADKQAEPYLKQAAALGQLSQAFSGLTSSMDESSGAYKALFAIQKGFAVASATMNAITAWMNALANGGPWPANLAAYGQAVAMTTSILSELASIKAYDKGGTIPSGAVGLVGEIGPELIKGPASVTSRKDTAKMLGNGDITINVVEDSNRAGQVSRTQTDSGEIIDIIVSNIRSGGGVSDAISTAYGLNRKGQ